MGAWIEIALVNDLYINTSVAPLVGAWIEIMLWLFKGKMPGVAPLVGAWIEIYCLECLLVLM